MVDVPSFDSLFIGGKWVAPASDRRFELRSPSTGELLASAPEAVEADVDAAIAAARDAFDNGPWPRMSAAERGAIMDRFYDLFIEHSNELAELITAEVGSPLLFSHFGQVGASGMTLDFFRNLVKSYEFEQVRDGMLGPVLVRREPVGVCAGIIPWNVPIFITM
ncbi:MAG TPA: aldehyde dehydrogenase family protein, partial [Microthrixaceae bacterium]|nr:aldehyde dehydrogenase family protein [Microthrixaceae bacterium]